MALRDPNGSVGSSGWWSRSEAEYVGRPVAPFGGCDAAPGSAGAILGRYAAILGCFAAILRRFAAILGFLSS